MNKLTEKEALKSIIKYLSKNDFYFCAETGELYNIGNGEMCYCADDLIQQFFDRIYTSVCDLLGGYRIDPKEELTESAIEYLTSRAQEEADENHYYFNIMTTREAERVIQEHKDLKQILFDRFTETAHK